MNETERRFTMVPVELRARGDRRAIGGYAAVFNKPSQNLGGFVEVVSKDFFNQSRGDGWPDVVARYNHDDNMLLGSTGGGTLHLDVDNTGLVYEVDMPSARQDVLELVERGDVRKSSFAFRVMPEGDEWSTTDQGFPMRVLRSGTLVDVAPVVSPAYLDTTSGVRSVETAPALRSLADHFDADLEEVRKLADAGELRKFFQRSDGPAPKPKQFGPQALLELKAKETPAV